MPSGYPVRPARPGDERAVAALLRVRAAWMAGRGLVRTVQPHGEPTRLLARRAALDPALTTADQHDEAAATAVDAVTSGLLVPSNHWRVAEVITAVQHAAVPATDLRDAYHHFCAEP
ncbi:hypothetical protein [Actinomadura rubteroloni]|uniref:hypothetical protein n=1 Tax=Actinomadura rubteroloni TaxID=1926885 RepID=UPI0011B09973|nr:hypothetical protein [Actinomadura rubteroloni]